MRGLLSFLRKAFRLVATLTLAPIVVGLTIFLFLYFRASSQLLPLNSEYDVESALRTTIEGERRSLRTQAGIIHDDVTWPRPTLADFPHDFVVMEVAVWRCPTFFQTKREPSSAWALRVLKAFVFETSMDGRDGKCEMHFARDLADNLRAGEGAPRYLATYRLREVLDRDQLLAYDLASLPLEQGYFGVQDASRLLLHRDLNQLSLAELAELAVALPPLNRYDDIHDCNGLLDVKKQRDEFLNRLGESGFIPLERAKAAWGEPLSCRQR